MIIRHSKKALMVSAFISLFIFIGFYFIFARYLTKDWDIYIIGFFISLIACFGPFLKELYKYKFNFLEIENGSQLLLRPFLIKIPPKILIMINNSVIVIITEGLANSFVGFTSTVISNDLTSPAR